MKHNCNLQAYESTEGQQRAGALDPTNCVHRSRTEHTHVLLDGFIHSLFLTVNDRAQK